MFSLHLKKKKKKKIQLEKKQLRMFSLVFDTLEANFPWMVTQLNGHSLVLQGELIYVRLCSQRRRTEQEGCIHQSNPGWILFSSDS